MQSFSVAGVYGVLGHSHLDFMMAVGLMQWVGIQFHYFVKRIATAHASYDTPKLL